MTEENKQPDASTSAQNETKEQTLMKSLSTPQSALVGIVMAFFGAGGMFSFDKLSTKLDDQSTKLSEMTTAITRMEAREAAFQESLTVARALAERHEERLRQQENQGIQREARLQAIEKLVEELRKGK